MHWASRLLLIPLFTFHLQAQTEDEVEKALQNLMILMEKSASTIKDFTQNRQPATPEEQSSFQLYYKQVQNGAKVEKRNDFLIKAQIQYRLLRAKNVSFNSLLIVVHNQNVELYGKVHSEKEAEDIINTTLHTKGVRSVTSYLIVKKLKRVVL
ncbi:MULTISPECIES: BON domain-containing protein [unclassified Nitratiruptor]|uniref:BON domain-containing protein n=1 Tax=unclassified Nitratiruptor TaxID=2624044 RepID=UPI00191697DD|nr:MULTISPECIES: BON domain-containing protein [unclassified Nitratiruptor]BCD60990.1 hypothetical protein NitYY0810_C1771 [Nitratiruptor sp. YY08-10]BCD64922.1 hypothetical protein NitYY0814_C1779 [Nitratiruptor sp. YY08-14]